VDEEFGGVDDLAEIVAVEEFGIGRGEEGLEVFGVGDQGLLLVEGEYVHKVFVLSEFLQVDEVQKWRDGRGGGAGEGRW
jgi:hypothetical protein